MPFFRPRIFLIILLVTFVFAGDSYAYMNPGAGSVAFQVVIAFLVTAGFILKIFFKKIKNFLVYSVFKREKR